MSGGTGRYTKFAAEASDKNTLLNKIFHSEHPTLKSPTQDLVGKEVEVRDQTVALANEKLVPSHQIGDLGHFPTGVDLDYTTAPTMEDVKWTKPGDPANPYTPDITSPGPGRTDGVDKDKDPNISVADLKPAYVPGAPGTGTKTPLSTAAKIIAASLLGVAGKNGASGA